MSLALETRLRIYEYVFSSITLQPAIITDTTRNLPFAKSLNVLLVNQQAYSETKDLLEHFARFRVTSKEQLKRIPQRQPLLSKMIYNDACACDTDFLTNELATTALRLLPRLRSVTFELPRGCLVAQPIENAVSRCLIPQDIDPAWRAIEDPSLIFYHSFTKSEYTKFSMQLGVDPRGRRVLERLVQIASSGIDINFNISRVKFLEKNPDPYWARPVCNALLHVQRTVLNHS